jgi:hypothetical protein
LPGTEKSLETPKPAEVAAPATKNDSGKGTVSAPTPEAGKPATPATDDATKAKDATTANAQPDASKPAAPAKKKSKFHVLKKVVDPF